MERFVGKDDIDYQVAGNDLFDIVNYNEPMVLEVMRELYGEDDEACRCNLCVEDVFALALNALPARYIQPTSLRAYSVSEHFIDRKEILAAVRHAMQTVGESPKH
jgi:competence protein ComFB